MIKNYLHKILVITSFFLIAINVNADDYYWNGGTGDWDVGSNWSDITGTIPFSTPPGPDDNVYIKKDAALNINPGDIITINPGNYEIKSLSIQDFIDINNKPKLLFNGTQATDTVNLNVNQDIFLHQYFLITYAEPVFNRWILHSANVHNIDSKGKDMNYVIVDLDNTKTTIIGNIKASQQFQVKNGELFGDAIDINTKHFLVYTSPNDLTHFKTINLINQSRIICGEFKASFNYETDSYAGDFLIDCHLFTGGNESDYGNVSVYLRDSILPTPTFYNMTGKGITIYDLTIDSDTKIVITGQISVHNFTVVQPNSEIVFNLKTSYQPDYNDPRRNTFPISGTVSMPTPPPSDCPALTQLYTTEGSLEKMEFVKNSGIVTFDHVRIRGIGTSGAATFNVTNGIVEDYASDWDNISGIPSVDYYWVGGSGNWDDPMHWATSSAGTGNGTCVPTLFDDVYFDGNSFPGGNNTVTINNNILNECKLLEWTAPINNKIEFSNNSGTRPELYVAGDLKLPSGMTILDPGNWGVFELIGTGNFVVDAPNIDLPDLNFKNASGTWTLLRHTTCRSIDLGGGALNTGNKDITLSKMVSSNASVPKFFELTSSTIVASDRIDFGIYSNTATVDAGTSYLKTKRFIASDGTFNIVHMVNTHDTLFFAKTYYIKKLILDSPYKLTTQDSLIVDSLILMQDGCELELSIDTWDYPTAGLEVKEGIRSYAPGTGAFPKIYSDEDGNGVTLHFLPHNLCVEGKISFRDVIGVGDGIIHVPDGISLGGNTNFNFSPTPSYSDKLFWIGGQGAWSVKKNWSTGSGACPADISPSNADTLIFDNYSTISGDTVFLPTIKNAKSLVMRNSDPSRTSRFYLGKQLKLTHSFILEGGNLIVDDDTSTISPAAIWVDKEVSLTNNTQLTIDSVTIYAGRKPSLLTKTTFSIDGTSSLTGTNGKIVIKGHSSIPGNKTVEIDLNASGDMTDISFEIRKAINGENDYHMSFDFGDHLIKKLLFNNQSPFLQGGAIQKYNIIGNVRTAYAIVNYGKLIVKSGNRIYTNQ